jgi:hypothetical protein
MSTFSLDDLRAAVGTAGDWNTYVTVQPRAADCSAGDWRREMHRACPPDGRSDSTAPAEKDVWLSIQPFVGDEDTVPHTGPSRTKMLQVIAGTDSAYRLARHTR